MHVLLASVGEKLELFLCVSEIEQRHVDTTQYIHWRKVTDISINGCEIFKNS